MTAKLFCTALSKGEADAFALSLLANMQLGDEVRASNKLNIDSIRKALMEVSFHGWERVAEATVDSLEVHRTLLKGLPGEAMYIASAMAFDSFKEGEEFFGMSTKTARHRIGRNLDAGEGEKALRLVSALSLATRTMGSTEEARAYMKTPNFALGGATPLDLLKTAVGEQLVLNELQTHMDGGPV